MVDQTRATRPSEAQPYEHDRQAQRGRCLAATGAARPTGWKKHGLVAFVTFCWVAIALLTGARQLFADEASARLCSRTVEQFVTALDKVLDENPNSVFVVTAVVDKYLPVDGCNISDVLSLSRKSKFFSEAYEQFASYTVSFRSDRFVVSFGLRKENGNIEFPAAGVILPRPKEYRTSVESRENNNA